ncbi:MAG: transporter substrate-binding domain-containing protein [Bacteriovoracaceae bacterium]|nr:transporter substrate-binding domain-containing protein [Bacteriovoracaceae bacterium]
MRVVISLLIIVSSSVFGKEIRIAVGSSLPPYVIESHEMGFELEIVRDALKEVGYEAVFQFFPAGEVYEQVVSKKFDAALTLKVKLGSPIYYSDDYITYKNAAVTLKRKSYVIDSIFDIRDFSVGSFKDSKRNLGRDFKMISNEIVKYTEYQDKTEQVKALLNEDVQVLVGDINIVKYFLKELKVDPEMIEVHQVFGQSNYQVGFVKQWHRDQFNRGLDLYKVSGRHLAKVNEYVE